MPSPKPSAQAPPNVQATDDWMADVHAELDAIESGKPIKKAEKPAKPSPDAPSKPADKPVEAPESKATTEPVKPSEKPADAPEVAPEDKPDPIKIVDLRNHYNELKKRAKVLRSDLANRESRLKELEAIKPEDNKPLLETIEKLKKENSEHLKELRFLNYKKHPEFVEKYEKPYNAAWKKAVEEIGELTVENEDGSVRAATAHDMQRLANMPLGEANKLARELFGDLAPDVMAHRRTIRELAQAQNEALERARTEGEEWEKQRTIEDQTKTKAQAETTMKLWQAVHDDLAKRFPRAFTPEEGDAEDKTEFERGSALVDLMFSGPQDKSVVARADLLPGFLAEAVKAGRPLTQPEQVRMHALVRLKAMNHDRILRRDKAKSARIAELEKALAEYEQSEPGAGKTGAPKNGTLESFEADANAELDAIEAKSRR